MHSKNYDYTDGVDEVVAAAAFYSCRHNRRKNTAWYHLNWSVHVKKLQRESQFHRMYRMSNGSYKKLLDILTPYLQVNAKQGSCHNWGMGYASPQLVLHYLPRTLKLLMMLG
jgi:hypothetical protein